MEGTREDRNRERNKERDREQTKGGDRRKRSRSKSPPDKRRRRSRSKERDVQKPPQPSGITLTPEEMALVDQRYKLKSETTKENKPKKTQVIEVTEPTKEEEEEALRLARIAAKAELKAKEREGIVVAEPPSLEELLKKKQEQATGLAATVSMPGGPALAKPKFLTKSEREQMALQRLEENRLRQQEALEAANKLRSEFLQGGENRLRMEREREREAARAEREAEREEREKEKEREELRKQYLGEKKQKKKIVKPSEKFSRIFQFDWELTDDTSKDLNPLYANRMQLNSLLGRGYIAGIDMREQRQNNSFIKALAEKRMEIEREAEKDRGLDRHERREREKLRQKQLDALDQAEKEQLEKLQDKTKDEGPHWSQKKLEEMTVRDWRILREDFDIRVKGGRAPLPMRSWEEGGVPQPVLEAIKELGFEKPSPIQRQGIPIGFEWRDMIGIAETGSGKTAAFIIPMVHYILGLPRIRRARTPDDGPLALIMAPTRELALQIEEEAKKLIKHTTFKTVCAVGGQPIEDQGFKIRAGCEIIVGTPGRLNDCLENAYLVLNQCNYVVLDEADRMIDMGFEPQVNAVLDAMGSVLKAEQEEEAYKQEEKAKKGDALYRVTSMFSATFPVEVQKLAQKFLRHPTIVQIGDEDSGKNKRIAQYVFMMPENSKKNKLLEILRRQTENDKFIIFVNAKKSADVLARTLETNGTRCGVLHGGKTQDQREASLEDFRADYFNVLVATDVAARGLDIPDVSQIINYDMPNNIQNYCHRIGRTGRAGKSGIATTFLTEGDDEVMYDLKQYLISTEAQVPHELASNPAAQNPSGARGEDGHLLHAKKRDQKIFVK